MKNCPYCAESVKYEAIFCRFCGHDLEQESRVPVSHPSAITPVRSAPSDRPGWIRAVWAILGWGSGAVLTIIALIGIASFYGIELAICGVFLFPVVFALYPFIFWYYTGTFPLVYFAISAFGMFALHKAYSQ